MTLSVFDIFKIGIGPSSSHTMGPMRAAHEFVAGTRARLGLLEATRRDRHFRLYGSLALTGVGHGTDRAILLGLEGADAESVDPDQMDPAVARIRASGRIRLLGRHEIPFDEPMQLLFMRHERLERHSNGMRFTALGEDRSMCCARRTISRSAVVSSCAAARRPRRLRAALHRPIRLSPAMNCCCARARAERALSSLSS